MEYLLIDSFGGAGKPNETTHTMTVGELVHSLEGYDEDYPVLLSFYNNGRPIYGAIRHNMISIEIMDEC